jgi:cytochrome c-type biogenesis protein CcmE
VAVLLVAVGLLAYNGLKSSATYYLTVSEVLAKGNSISQDVFRVTGNVEDGSIVKDPATSVLRFNIVSEGKKLPVTYKGIVPDMFKEDIEVVVEGSLDSTGVFKASTILTKCPSKYVPEK